MKKTTYHSRFLPPKMKKTTIITPPHPNKFNPDGSLNLQYHIQGAGIFYNAITEDSVMFFTGRHSFPGTPDGSIRSYPHSAIFAARSNNNWKTIIFFDAANKIISDRSSAMPVLHTPGEMSYAMDGQEDPRVTTLAGGIYIVANAINREQERKTFRESAIQKNLSLPLKGATPELYFIKRPDKPKSYTYLGRIGPDEEYFKNVIIHPELITIQGELYVLIFGRKLPGIQGFTIPVSEFPLLTSDDDYRKKYWDKKLQSDNIEHATILSPTFRWEAKGNPYYPKGQIAGGAPPVKVFYKDYVTNKQKPAWLFIYNAAPEFDENYYATGRVVGVALLDYTNPFIVIARSPLPIIYPTEPDEISEGRHPNTTFATGAYVDKTGILRIFYSAGGKNISMASCPVEDMTNYLIKLSG